MTNGWVAVKEARRWFAENCMSWKGDPGGGNLSNAIKIHQLLMQREDAWSYVLKQLDVYVILELVQGGELHSNNG